MAIHTPTVQGRKGEGQSVREEGGCSGGQNVPGVGDEEVHILGDQTYEVWGAQTFGAEVPRGSACPLHREGGSPCENNDAATCGRSLGLWSDSLEGGREGGEGGEGGEEEGWNDEGRMAEGRGEREEDGGGQIRRGERD